MANYTMKKILATILTIATTSVSIAGCGGLEGCGLKSCGLESCGGLGSCGGLVGCNDGEVAPTAIPSIAIASPTSGPTNTPTPTTEPTNTPTPTPLPGIISASGENTRIFIYDSIEEMNEAMGETGEKDALPIDRVAATEGTAYLRVYVLNPSGKEPDGYKITDPDGNEVIILNHVMYKNEWMLLTDFTEGYTFTAYFTDENGQPTELGFEWSPSSLSYEITAEYGKNANIRFVTSYVAPVTPTPIPEVTATPTSTPTPAPTATATPSPKPTNTPTPTKVANVTPRAYYALNVPQDSTRVASRMWDFKTGNMKSLEKNPLLMDDPNFEVVYKVELGNAYTTGINTNFVSYYMSNGEPFYLRYNTYNFFLMEKGANPVGYLTDSGNRNDYKKVGYDASKLPPVLDENGNKIYFTHFQQADVTCTPIPTFTDYVKVDVNSATTDNKVHQVYAENKYPINTYYLEYTDKYKNNLVRFCDSKGNVVNDEFYMDYEMAIGPDGCTLRYIPVNEQRMRYNIVLKYRNNNVVLYAATYIDRQFRFDGYAYYDDTMWDMSRMKPLGKGFTKLSLIDHSGMLVEPGCEFDEKLNRFVWFYFDCTTCNNKHSKDNIIYINK